MLANATSAVTISGSGLHTLTINATNANGNTAGNGINMDSAAGALTISANVALGGNQTWTNNSTTNSLTVSGQVSGGFSLTKAGVGTVVLSNATGNSYTGGTTINNGLLQVSNSSGSATGTGNVVVNSGGSLRGAGFIAPSTTNSITVNAGGTIIGGSSTSTLTIGGTGVTLNLGNGASGAILGTELAHTGITSPGFGTANASLISLLNNDVLNLNAGLGNTFTINLVDSGLNGGIQDLTSYTVTLATVATAGNIKLNGVTQTANTVIATSNYNITTTGFGNSLTSASLFVDGTGTMLQMTFATPEPHHIMLICVAVLLMGVYGRRWFLRRKLAAI